MLKAIVAGLSAALVVLHTVLLSGGIVSWADWQTIVDAAIGPVLVYLVPNMPPAAVLFAPPVAEPVVNDKTLITPLSQQPEGLPRV